MPESLIGRLVLGLEDKSLGTYCRWLMTMDACSHQYNRLLPEPMFSDPLHDVSRGVATWNYRRKCLNWGHLITYLASVPPHALSLALG